MRRELPAQGIESGVPRLHARFRTPRPTIFSIVREATGQDSDPETLTKILRGYDSEVYRVRTTTGGGVIVRIAREGGTLYQDEAWAIASARAAGAPVPEILLLTTRRINRIERPVMAQRCLPGRNLSDLFTRLSRDQQERLTAEVGAALRKIHSVAVGGFGARAAGFWEFPTWEEHRVSVRRGIEEETALLHEAGLSSGEIRRGLDAMAQYDRDYPCGHPFLCHADFSAEHIMADDEGNLTGIIDFGDFQGGAPETDIVSWSEYGPENVPLHWLKRGYGDADWWGDDADFQRRLRLLKIWILLDDITFVQGMKNAEESERLVAAFRETLRR